MEHSSPGRLPGASASSSGGIPCKKGVLRLHPLGISWFCAAMKSVVFASLLALALGACGADTPTPDYPFPEQEPLEETDLAPFLGDEGGEDDYEEDEEWDDGLDDADLDMNGEGSEGAEAAAEEAPAEDAAAE